MQWFVVEYVAQLCWISSVYCKIVFIYRFAILIYLKLAEVGVCLFVPGKTTTTRNRLMLYFNGVLYQHISHHDWTGFVEYYRLSDGYVVILKWIISYIFSMYGYIVFMEIKLKSWWRFGFKKHKCLAILEILLLKKAFIMLNFYMKFANNNMICYNAVVYIVHHHFHIFTW